MVRTNKVEKLIEQLIANQLETHLTRMVRKSKKRAEREKAKLKEFLQLPLIKDEDIVEAEYDEAPTKELEGDFKKRKRIVEITRPKRNNHHMMMRL